MGIFDPGIKTTLEHINKTNELFPLYVGECTSGKKIVESKLIFNLVISTNPQLAIEALIKIAKEAGYDAITNINFYSKGVSLGGLYAYGNMVKYA